MGHELESTFLGLHVSFAAIQHEGHHPEATVSTEGSRSQTRSDETPCQRVTRLAAELEGQYRVLASSSDVSELRKQLSENREKIEELRAAAQFCSTHCEKPHKQKHSHRGCGHGMMQH